ncbi:helix-turn-helix domain-containing protein [Cyclobacterium xiamenense]|uniref:helix-turn-helix domain-containing protein n=1 Tax=Cyclobacterium xiamenense TaxID=1297121 RepID=UPI0035CEA51E
MSSNIRILRICQHCGQEFTAKTTVTKYCGEICAKKAYKIRKRKEKVRKVASIPIQKSEFNQHKIQDKDFLSIAETCELLGASRMTLYRQIKNGTIKAAKIGRRTIIKRTDIEKLFQP